MVHNLYSFKYIAYLNSCYIFGLLQNINLWTIFRRHSYTADFYEFTIERTECIEYI